MEEKTKTTTTLLRSNWVIVRDQDITSRYQETCILKAWIRRERCLGDKHVSNDLIDSSRS